MGSSTSSSLTLRALLKSAASRLGMGVPARAVTGLTPAAKAMFAAVAASRGRALIEEAAVIDRILRHLGLPTDVPIARPARAPPLFGAGGETHADEYESAP